MQVSTITRGDDTHTHTTTDNKNKKMICTIQHFFKHFSNFNGAKFTFIDVNQIFSRPNHCCIWKNNCWSRAAKLRSLFSFLFILIYSYADWYIFSWWIDIDIELKHIYIYIDIWYICAYIYMDVFSFFSFWVCYTLRPACLSSGRFSILELTYEKEKDLWICIEKAKSTS